jgi:hypothetical protein
MYPEGQLHRETGPAATPSALSKKLQPFRTGGMGIAIQYDMELWCWAAKGNNDVWPVRCYPYPSSPREPAPRRAAPASMRPRPHAAPPRARMGMPTR